MTVNPTKSTSQPSWMTAIQNNPNGTYEILAKSPLNGETIAGPRYLPWVDIYQWDGEGYIKARSHPKTFFKVIRAQAI